MNLSAYIEKEYKTNKLSKELIEELKKYRRIKNLYLGFCLMSKMMKIN